ncbi:MAG: replication/maintenance protein RepL [Clostridia bacterium]|nr:replication/maintenance protein RepL [Clostridia bacterium]
MNTTNYDESSQTQITSTGLLLIDPDSGEVKSDVKKKRYGPHFWRLYLQGLLCALGKLNLTLLDVLCFIIENISLSDNTCSFTQTEIAKALSLSRATVGRHLETLEAAGFIKKIRNGKYMVNPEIMLYDISEGNTQYNILMRMYYDNEPITDTHSKPKHCKTKHTKANTEKRKQKKAGDNNG